MKGHTLPGINQRSPMRADDAEAGDQAAAAIVSSVAAPAMEALLREKPKVSGPNLKNPGEAFADIEIGTGSPIAKKPSPLKEPIIAAALIGSIMGPVMGKMLSGDGPAAPTPSLDNPGEAFGKLKIGTGASSKKP